jgi:ribonuclease P protein component
MPETPGPHPRVGFTASKKVGNAVARNRARRRLKAAVKLVLGERAGENMDYVVIARAATVERPYAALLEDLRGALHRVHRPEQNHRHEKNRETGENLDNREPQR